MLLIDHYNHAFRSIHFLLNWERTVSTECKSILGLSIIIVGNYNATGWETTLSKCMKASKNVLPV